MAINNGREIALQNFAYHKYGSTRLTDDQMTRARMELDVASSEQLQELALGIPRRQAKVANDIRRAFLLLYSNGDI